MTPPSNAAFLLRLSPLLVLILTGPRMALADFRPPAVPLVTYNPFLSIWSEDDHLNDANTKHWTHREHSLVSLIRVDGKAYRLMGGEPENLPKFRQRSVAVEPTRSLYGFEDAGIQVTVTFTQPALPSDLDVYSWPLSYITWEIRSADGARHQVEIYDSTSSQLAVNSPGEPVEWLRAEEGSLTTLRVGTSAQPILGSSGDDHRIDWGYAYAAARSAESKSAIGANEVLEKRFAESGGLPAKDDARMPRAVNDSQPVLAFCFDLGRVGGTPVRRQVIVAYDEIFAIKFFGANLRPYWARNGASIGKLLQKASDSYASVAARCESFDRELTADMTRLGGEHYSKITALAYRECVAANGLAADVNGQPLLFTKENTSNGDIATVDVFFPMDPVWILLSPTLAKASLVHVLMYSASPHWKFPNAPHDLGRYPLAFGRDDGGEAMAVEESGNMLILCDAIAHVDRNADFVKPWWPQLTQWAQYLEQFGLDPEEQLCTDDFMGRLAHNSNLSIKAVVALAAYGDLCRLRGDEANAKRYSGMAKTDAAHWIKAAWEGDHSRIAFDKPGTWSQKYNLVWDHILGLDVFPSWVAKREVAFYERNLQPFGLPLDSRTLSMPPDKSRKQFLTKTDWTIWCAAMAENRSDFEALIDPIFLYLNGTTARDPIADSYQTHDLSSRGMHARPVVGGFFIKMLTDSATWRKWASRDTQSPANWAPLPGP